MKAQPTVAQWRVWKELNFWHGMLACAEDHKLTKFVPGLCYMASIELQWLSKLPKRARAGHMGLEGYWWPSYQWRPRREFIRKMIHLCEQELNTKPVVQEGQ